MTDGALTEAVNYRMFVMVSRKAIRDGLRAEGRKIGRVELQAESESLAYDLAEVARNRIGELAVEAVSR
jgi:hypothetical protein